MVCVIRVRAICRVAIFTDTRDNIALPMACHQGGRKSAWMACRSQFIGRGWVALLVLCLISSSLAGNGYGGLAVDEKKGAILLCKEGMGTRLYCQTCDIAWLARSGLLLEEASAH
jgi:hypothetical protein